MGILGGLYYHIVPFIILPFFALIIVLKNLKIQKYHCLIKLIKVWFPNNVLYLFLISYLIGSLYLQYCDSRYEKIYNQFLDKEIIATVVSSPKVTEYKNIYQIKVKEKGIKFLLRIDKNKNVSLQYGDQIKVKGSYEKPESARNYKGFNYQQILKTQKISGIFEAEKIEIIDKNKAGYIAKLSNNVRQGIIYRIRQILPNQTSELFLGILIGYDDNLQEEIVESFRKSSLSHLLAVSGAHINYIMIGLAYCMVKFRIPKWLRNILTSLFLIFFMYLTNFSASVMRASLMGIISLLSLLVQRRYDLKTSMCFSILVILLENPYRILDVGLLLSYFATIGIIAFVSLQKKDKEDSKDKWSSKIKKVLKDMIMITISANIFVIPIILYSFNTLSLNFILSNLIAGILIGPITIGGFILIILSFIHIKLAYIFAIPYQLLLQILIKTTELVSKIPLSEVMLPTPPIILIVLYYLLLAFIIIYQLLKKNYSNHYLVKKLIKYIQNLRLINKQKKMKFCLLVFLAISFISILTIIPQDFKLYFIDVGQGDSTLIVTPNKQKILIDSGGQETGNFDVGESTLVPYLLDRGITTIDYICISHFDSDHCQGFIYLLQHIRVKNVIFSKQAEDSSNFEEIFNIIQEKKINMVIVEKGDKIVIEPNIYLQVLWPDTNHFISENALNNNSLIFKLYYQNFSILFTGDIEEIAEKEILEAYKNTNALKSNVLKVAHHRLKKF